jgi:hypothetical protein
VPTVTSVRAFCPLHDSSDKAILDSSIGAALETREESSHGGHGGHGGCLKIGNQWFCCQALDPLSPDLGGGMNTKSSSSQNETTKAIPSNENKIPVIMASGIRYRSAKKFSVRVEEALHQGHIIGRCLAISSCQRSWPLPFPRLS